MPPHGAPSLKPTVYLERAGVKRRELFVTDATRKAMAFHDLPATGITWCAVRGDDPLRIEQRAGHASFDTTQGCIREAENLRAGFGGVFPPLPACLFEAAETSRESSRGRRRLPKWLSSLDNPGGEDGIRTRV